jgi:hypothetical protein
MSKKNYIKNDLHTDNTPITKMIAAGDKVYILKRGNKTIGASVNYGEHSRHYIVAFGTEKMTQRLKHTMHLERKIHLDDDRHVFDTDVTNDVVCMLNEKSNNILQLHDSSIMINIKSKMYVSKRTDYSENNITTESMDATELYMMPFEKNIGVIIPNDVFYESPQELVYNCSVIEPSTNYTLFKIALEKSTSFR